uniref:Uncharacterized protein n=1 Tax=Trichogramma kaykai TaxID=54128 RepID=A0ABD2XCR0_9HYME
MAPKPLRECVYHRGRTTHARRSSKVCFWSDACEKRKRSSSSSSAGIMPRAGENAKRGACHAYYYVYIIYISSGERRGIRKRDFIIIERGKKSWLPHDFLRFASLTRAHF